MNRRDVLKIGGGVMALGWPMVAQATSDPIPGIDVIVKKCYPCVVMNKALSDKQGVSALERLLAGEYEVVVKTSSVMALRTTVTVGKLEPIVTETKTGMTVTPITVKEAGMLRVLVEAL